MAGKTYNVGVIGYGMSAKVFHIPLVLVTPAFKLHSIVQRHPTPQNSASKDHPGVQILPSAEALFTSPAIDVVIVTTTPETHFAFTKSALEAGKHVLVEKPFVPTAAQALTLSQLSQKTGKLICVYQNRRWDTDFLTFRKLQKDGKLGRIVEFETHFDRWKPEKPATWKGTLGMEQAGGVIYDLGTHLLDQIYVAFGMPKCVTAVFANQRGEEMKDGVEPDSITVLLQFEYGMLATAKAGIMSAEVEQLRFWVRGTQGCYRKYHLDCQEDQLKAGLKPGDEGFGVEDASRAGFYTTMVDGKPLKQVMKNIEPETYAALYAGFVKAIENNDAAAVPVKASEAAEVLKIIEAARESAKTGKTITL